MLWLRAIAIWVLLAGIMIAHGAIRESLLTPLVGEFTARQLSVLTGSAVIWFVACLFIRWIAARSTGQLLAVGFLWLVLTLLFEIVLGRVVLGLPWEKVLADLDPFQGGLFLIVLLVVVISPLCAARIRHFISGPTHPMPMPSAEVIRQRGDSRCSR